MASIKRVSKRPWNLLLVALSLFGPATSFLEGQSASHIVVEKANSPVFEVATIKPNNKQDGRWHLAPTQDGYSAMGVSLLQLIEESYGITAKERISGGPPWLDSDKFDIEAKLDPVDMPSGGKKLTDIELAAMRALLAERFGLKVHVDSKVFPVFNLVVAKGGPKLGGVATGNSVREDCLISHKGYEGCTMANYAEALRYKSGRIVLDKTGITGRFDFQPARPSDTTTKEEKSSGTWLFSALQDQLGLKLVPSTATLDVLVVDSAEHPSAN